MTRRRRNKSETERKETRLEEVQQKKGMLRALKRKTFQSKFREQMKLVWEEINQCFYEDQRYQTTEQAIE